MWIILIAIACSSFTISQIPESGSPPDPRVLVTTAYDSNSNQLVFLGGQGLKGSNDWSSTLYAYNLNTFSWRTIPSKMGIVPLGLKDTKMYFRKSDNKLFVIGGFTKKGSNTVVYSFDLERFFWNVEVLSGDVMVSTTRSAFSSFSYKNIEYIAIYGGYSSKGLIDDFYLIEVEKMHVKKMPRNGDHPGLRLRTQNFYYNESYYMFGVNMLLSNISLFKFDLENETWSSIQTSGEKPPDLLYHEIFIKGDSFYLINGVNSQYFEPNLAYFRFDFHTSNWVKLKSYLNIEEWTYFHAITQVNGKVYKGFGKNIFGYLNSLSMIELGDEMIYTVLSPLYLSPEPRRNHLSFLSNREMYIYGGITDEDVFLKDLWKYNFESKIWKKVDYSGIPPLNRENMAYTSVYDIGMIAFGGQSGDDFFNDIYFYEQKNSIWVKYTGYENAPNPRYGSCIVYSKQKLFVIGGKNNQFAFSDIWIYDSLENKFTLLDSKLSFSIAFHKCWSVEKENQIYIYSMGGQTFEGVPNKMINRIIVTIYSDTEYFVKAEEEFFDYFINLYNTALVVSGNSANMIIGCSIEGVINATMISYDFCKKKVTYKMFPNQYGVFGHSAVHYGKSIYVFGGGYAIENNQIENSATNILYNFSLPEILNCSLGLYEEDSLCKSCPVGTYGKFESECNSDEYCSLCSVTKNTCLGCNAGKYSNSEGSASKYTCSLCSQGQFSDNIGSTKCKDCSQSSFCPIGSIKPLKYIDKYEFSSVQPQVFSTQKNFTSLLVNNLWYSVAAITLIIFLSFGLVSKVRHSLLKIDIYTDAHPQDLNVPVMYRKTSLGGLFSIIFFVFLIAILISAYITYTYDNIAETRTLVPLVTIDEKPKANEFIVYAKFYVYGGECIGDGKGNCNTELFINDSGLDYKKRSVECELVDKNCLVKMVYKDIEISGNFEIYYKMKEFLSYTNLMTVNISVSTGIPGGNSKNFIPIYPEPEKFIFRGSSPTILVFETIPTFFRSESSKWNSFGSGFHLRYEQNPQYGSMIDSAQLYTTSYVYLKLKFQISNTALNVFRELKTSLYLLFSGLLGMVAGVLESVGTAMGYFEDLVNNFISKRKKKMKFSKIFHRREKFNDFLFIDKVVVQRNRKQTFLKPEYYETSKRSLNSTDIRLN